MACARNFEGCAVTVSAFIIGAFVSTASERSVYGV